MCGIAALQLRNPKLHSDLGRLVYGMLGEIVERGPDSAGLALYGNPALNPPGRSSIALLDVQMDPDTLADALSRAGLDPAITRLGETTLLTSSASTTDLESAVEQILPGVQIAGRGNHVTVLKGTGHPLDLADTYQLRGTAGFQALAHTRMATESAVTASGAHPFTVADDLCLVHNGSFSNHATIRRSLRLEGVRFDSENDSEVAARYIAHRLRHGDDLTTALTHLGDYFDGFYTLVVTTPASLAIVRDPIACKPAIIAETDDWVAMASEYRALAGLPGIDDAHVFEPSPGIVYTWELGPAALEEAMAR